jgi:hypothetical protein
MRAAKSPRPIVRDCITSCLKEKPADLRAGGLAFMSRYTLPDPHHHFGRPRLTDGYRLSWRACVSSRCRLHFCVIGAFDCPDPLPLFNSNLHGKEPQPSGDGARAMTVGGPVHCPAETCAGPSQPRWSNPDRLTSILRLRCNFANCQAATLRKFSKAIRRMAWLEPMAPCIGRLQARITIANLARRGFRSIPSACTNEVLVSRSIPLCGSKTWGSNPSACEPAGC